MSWDQKENKISFKGIDSTTYINKLWKNKDYNFQWPTSSTNYNYNFNKEFKAENNKDPLILITRGF